MNLSDYVGIPYRLQGRDRAGADCWGLPRLVLHEKRGVLLPSYDESYVPGQPFARSAEMKRAVATEWVKVERPQAFDFVQMRIDGLPFHVGIVGEPGWMLHTTQETDSVYHQWAGRWEQRILGFYRLRALCPS